MDYILRNMKDAQDLAAGAKIAVEFEASDKDRKVRSVVTRTVDGRKYDVWWVSSGSVVVSAQGEGQLFLGIPC